MSNKTPDRISEPPSVAPPACVLPVPPRPCVATAEGGAFAVRRIYAVGRNYAAHAREMGNDDRQPPVFFLKPADTVIVPDACVPYPPGTADLHHEIEWVAAMGVGGRDIPPARALEHVWGYGAGLDMTRRDRQKSLQAGGNPWEEGKVFDCAAPVSPLQPVHRVGHPARGRIWLEVDGDTRQSADIASMTWSLPEIIAHLSALFTLAPGDLIFTGTPAGVGPVSRGQRLHGGVEGIAEIAVRIV